MDVVLYGMDDMKLGDDEFKVSIIMLNVLFDRGVKCWLGCIF